MPFSAHRIASKRLVLVLNAVILLAACTTPATAATVETADRESVPDHDLASGGKGVYHDLSLLPW